MNSLEQHEELTIRIEEEIRAGRHRASISTTTFTPHPSGERLYNYALGGLDADEETEIQRHLARCSACVQALGAILKFEQSLGEPDAQPSLAERAILWISEFWMPRWAGELVTAADIPAQNHRFEMATGGGEMTISCFWRGEGEREPAYLHIEWRADMVIAGEFRIRFVSPETQETLAELPLGTRLRGEKTFTPSELGFDPACQRWGFSIVLTKKEAEEERA